MIGLSRGLIVYAYAEPTDMRKSFNTLGALVEQEMKRSVLSGDLSSVARTTTAPSPAAAPRPPPSCTR